LNAALFVVISYLINFVRETSNEWHHLSRRAYRRRAGHPQLSRSALSYPFVRQEVNLNISNPSAETLSVRKDAAPFTSYVDFSAAWAGALLALAVSFILLSFGAAVGFSAVSPWTTTSAGKALSFGAAFWVLLVEAWAFALGGYISGRMRHRWHDGVASEVTFRDGAHGLLMWGLAIVLGAIIAATAASYTGRSGLDSSRGDSYRLNDPTAIVLDPLFRPADNADLKTEARLDEARGEAVRLLATSVTKDGISVSDRAYLTRLVAAKAGVAAPEADARVQTAIVKSKDAANKARKVGVVVGFLTAASLLIGAAVAWWAATLGGQHRDAGTVWSVFGDMSPPSRRLHE
jgi:hypothetical protein